MPTLPGHDQKILAQPLGRHPGGTGGNVACAMSRLGQRTGMVSWVGHDADGQLILDDLRRFGVDTGHVTITPGTTTNYTTVLLDPSGEKAILVVPTSFDVLDLTPALITYLLQARLVYVAPYDLEQLKTIARLVRPAGGRVCTDIESVAGLQDDRLEKVLALVDLAFFNAGALPGDNYPQMAQTLQAAGPELIVITRGARGALAYNGREIAEFPAYTVPVVDTTGAGDCFMAAFLAAYLHHSPLPQALAYASAAAALAIQAYGARGMLPTHNQIEAFLAQSM